jgi:hypothetical protein
VREMGGYLGHLRRGQRRGVLFFFVGMVYISRYVVLRIDYAVATRELGAFNLGPCASHRRPSLLSLPVLQRQCSWCATTSTACSSNVVHSTFQDYALIMLD